MYYWKAVAMFVAVSVLLGGAGRSLAWEPNTHEELSRQATLYMLRSSTPDLRLAGVMITQAGEGLKAGVSLKRRWPLAREARDVDFYREIAVRNMHDTPMASPIMYYFLDYGFAGFNHALHPSNDKGITNFHDNHPGYCMAYDSSLTDLQGKVLLAIASDDANYYCTKEAELAVRNTVTDILTMDGPVGKTLNPLGLGVSWFLGKVAGWAVDGICPKLVGDHGFSPALSQGLYENNHSTATKGDFHLKNLKDVRWHPIDNLATAGASLFVNSSNALDYEWLINNRSNQLSPQVHPVQLCHDDKAPRGRGSGSRG